MGLLEEGIPLAKEALEIGERLGDPVVEARCLAELAWSLCENRELDAAEEAGSRAIDLYPEKGEEYRVCKSHRILGYIYQSKGEIEKAIHHFEVALGIASPFDWHDELSFRFITSWCICFSTKAGSMTHKLTSNAPSRTRPIAHTTWAM
jgi:tetratricopeptide (TPR) repeat protein